MFFRSKAGDREQIPGAETGDYQSLYQYSRQYNRPFTILASGISPPGGSLVLHKPVLERLALNHPVFANLLPESKVNPEGGLSPAVFFRPGAGLIDRLIRNVRKPLTENRLERYLTGNLFLSYRENSSYSDHVPVDSSFSRAVITHLMIEKRIRQAYQEQYSRRLKQERAGRAKKIGTVVTGHPSNEAILRRSELNQSELRLLQNKRPFVLSNRVSYRDRESVGTEMLILAPSVAARDYHQGYVNSLPPITHKSEERDSSPRPSEPKVKSLNTPVEIRKTSKEIIADVDLMNPSQLNKLVDKVYSQLETRLTRERRRFGY